MLIVSRLGVETDDIVDFNVQERFIKLPIVPYLKLLSVVVNGRKTNAYDEINSAQIALINAINDPRFRFLCAALSRRLGKTFISNVIGQLVVLIPGFNVLIMSPNYNLSSISFELQRSLIKQFDLEIERDNLKDKVIRLANGSEIRMGSVSTVDSSVGRSYDLIIFDEAALNDDGEEAFEIALRPTLDRANSKAIFISTPRGKNNWFSKFFDRGFSGEYPEWVSIRADYLENPRMSEKDVAEARKSMSKAHFEQEYMASFNVYEGQIYNVQADRNIVPPILEMIDGDETLAGLDPGYRDPTAFVSILYRAQEDCFYIVDEYLEAEAVTSKHAERFQEYIDKWKIDPIFIDAAAAQMAADLAHIYNISTINGKKDTLAGIALVQTMIEQGRLKICSHCTKTLEAFDQYQWDQRDTILKERPLHKHSHIPDAVRYALHTYTL